MNTKIILLTLVIILTTILFNKKSAAAADTLNPCWKLEWPDDPQHGFTNPDSVMFDSCLCPQPQYDEYGTGCPYKYTKRYFSFFLPYWALWMPEYPSDTIIYKTWQDIDTNYRELRQDFSNMEYIFGKYYIQKVYPESTDSTSLGSRYFYILFIKYQDIDDILITFDTITDLENFGYAGRDFHYAGSVKNIDITEKFYEIKFEMNYIKVQIIQINYIKYYNLNIYNYLGNRMYSQSFSNTEEIVIDISEYIHGIYFLQINNKIYKFFK